MMRQNGDTTKNAKVGVFRRIIMVPTLINIGGDVESLPRTIVVPWEDQGAITAEEAAMMEGSVGAKIVYWNPMYTVYEEIYLVSRWGGFEYGLPPFPK